MMGSTEVRKPSKYELVAPDGGWGYVIWIAITINLITTSAFVSCVGMIYNDVFIHLEMDSRSVSLLNGITSICVSISAFVTGPLMDCITMRKLGVLSTFLLNLGTFGIAFVNSKVLLFLLFGILQGLGNGFLVNITFTTLNQYFLKKRMLTVAITQTVTATTSIFTPQLVKWSSGEYGYRGTLILISGIYMQSFIAIALMQPVEWHMKKIELSEYKDIENKTLLTHDEVPKRKSSMPTVKLSDSERLLSVPEEKKELMENELSANVKKNSVFREMFRDFFDIPFLKSFLLSNASIGIAISLFCDVIFMIMLPQALYSMQWTEGEVAWAISLNNFGDLIMKVIFILFNNILLKFGNSEIYIGGLILAFFTRLGMLWSNNPTVMLVFIVMMGMSKSVSAMMFTLVIADVVDKEKFTAAIGIFMLLYGIVFLIIGPLVGAVRDLTNSYGTAFYIVTSCYGIVAMFWVIELLYKRNKDKAVEKKKKQAAA